MSAFVLDCSVAVAWLMDDEASSETDELLAQLCNDDALAPGLWRQELGNALLQAEKRGRVTAVQITNMLEFIGGLPIIIDTDDNRTLREILNFARAESLTTYDAAYLELAMRHGIPLATLDKTLINVAKKNNVKTLPA